VIPQPAFDSDPSVLRVFPLLQAMLSSALMNTTVEASAILPTTSRMELDTHANMPVVGNKAYILSDTGRTASVSAYNPTYPSQCIPIVDAAVLYQDPSQGREFILVLRNALHVPSMTNHLIPPFLMREHGITVNDTPKIQLPNPSVDDHAILLDSTFRIPLSLSGVFSYFETRKPTLEDLQALSDNIYLLTPEEFNPHNSVYADNEDRMLDWEGELVAPTARTKILIDDIPQSDAAVYATLALSSKEQTVIDDNLLPSPTDEACDLNDYDVELCSLSGVLCERTLCARLSARREVAAMMNSVGSCHAAPGPTLLDDDLLPDPVSPASPVTVCENVIHDERSESDLLESLQHAINNGEVDLDVSSTYASPSRRVPAAPLSS